MANRNTDNEKWTPEFRRLSAEAKLLWVYVWDHCDNAGVWRVDLDAASLFTGERIDEAAAAELEDRVVVFDEGRKWGLRDFLRINVAKTLSPKSPYHASILKLLEQHGVDLCYQQTGTNPGPNPTGNPSATLAEGVQEGVQETPLVRQGKVRQGKEGVGVDDSDDLDASPLRGSSGRGRMTASPLAVDIVDLLEQHVLARCGRLEVSAGDRQLWQEQVTAWLRDGKRDPRLALRVAEYLAAHGEAFVGVADARQFGWQFDKLHQAMLRATNGPLPAAGGGFESDTARRLRERRERKKRTEG